MHFKDPERVLDQFVLGEGRIVADFGAGNGAYALSAAGRVGDTGKVYAIDVQRDLLQRLKSAASAARIHNIEIVWGNLEKEGGSGIKDGVADAVIVSNVLFQAEQKAMVAKESFRILKTGGRALVIDWSSAGSVLGPPSQHLVSPEDARAIFEDSGFAYERSIDAGAHHYGMVFRKI